MLSIRRLSSALLFASFGIGLIGLLTPHASVADQIICVHTTAFDKSLSQLDLVSGNKWQEFKDADAINGVAMTAPGPNDTGDAAANGPWLVYKLPVDVKAGEATAGGKKWQIWVRMRVSTDKNSFFWQLSTDAKTWKPTPNTNANRVNDDGMNFSDKWYWQDQLTGNDGAVDPELAVGRNWLRAGPRETDPEAGKSPRFDVVCVRNFGQLGAAGAPKDDEVKGLLAATPVQPRGKLALRWAEVKRTR